MLRLIGTDANQYYSWDLGPGAYVIGRKSGSSPSDFIVSDMSVSRRHARLEIRPDGKQCFLTDLDSHNGTYVNGDKITGCVEIHSGDNVF